jgi:hypothetical protein
MQRRPSRPLNLFDFTGIDWDSDHDPDGNLAHCLRHEVNGRVVAEVLNTEWVDVEMLVCTAELAIIGPNAKRSVMWTLLFDTSWKDTSLLRPVTGWKSERPDIRAWEKETRKKWRRRR